MNAAVALHTGRIKVAAPFQNNYLVDTEVGEVMATALETGSGRRGGHIGGGAYVPGATVLVAVISVTDLRPNRNIGFPNIILGAFNPFSVFEGTDFQPTWIQQDSQSDALRNEGYRRILEAEPNTTLNENRGSNRPLDILPGDWFKSTVLGGLFLLSEFMATVGSSPDCEISFNGVDQLAELVSMNFSADHASVFRELIHRGLTAVDVSKYALTISEGLGAEIPLKKVEDTEDPWRLEPTIENQTGFFRDERFSGGAVEGAWRFCRTTLDPVGPHTFGSHTYPGVFSEMARMDGIYRLRAAKEICFEKTSAIVTPWMLQELRGAPPPPEEDPPSSEEPPPPLTEIEFRKDLLEEAQLLPGEEAQLLPGEEGPKEEPVSDDEVYALMPLFYDVFSTAEEAEVFFKGLRKDDHIWHFPTKDEAQEAIFGKQSEEEKKKGTRVLEKEEREYTLSDLVSKDLEIYPGRKVKLFRNSSVFLMSDDGGITIGDGFGGEIRMHRGRVTIASIGDIEFLPGRDLIEQVPGNRITRAGKRVEISSTDGSVAIKAQTNMQLVSGGKDGGILTVENRSPACNLSEIKPDDMRQDLPFGSGIMLKCTEKSGISLLGSHIYGGGYSQGVESETGISSALIPCDIMLDAGNKDLMLNGQNGIMSFRNSISMSLMHSVTGMYVASNAIVNVAPGGVSMVTPRVQMEGMQDAKMARPVLNRVRVDTTDPHPLPSDHTTLFVRGGLVAGEEGIRTEGSIAAEGNVTANDGVTVAALTEYSRHRFNMEGGEQRRAERIQRTLNTVSMATGSLMQRMVVQGVATEKGQRITEFAFPDSSAYRAGPVREAIQKNETKKDELVVYPSFYKLLAPKWQTILSSKAPVWIERSLAHAILKETYPYPGRDAHKSQTALETRKDNMVETGPLEAYKTNL